MISLACVRVCVVYVESVVIGVSVFGLKSMFLDVFPSLVMRFSCHVSDFVMGGCSFVFISLGGGWAIVHIVWAVYGLHNHFCRYVDLVGGDFFRIGELLDGD
jgi:hypothetical protein